MSNLISIGKIIDQTWDHFVAHFKPMMRVTLWFFLASLLWVLVIIFTPVSDPSAFFLGVAEDPNSTRVILLSIITYIVSPVVGMWIFLTLVQMIALQRTNKKTDTKVLGAKSWQMFLSFLWIVILKFLAVMVPLLALVPGTALLIYNTAGPQIPNMSAIGILLAFIGTIVAFIGVVWVGVVFHFSEYNLIFKGTRGVQAMKDAKKMVKGRFWATLWRLILPKLVFIIPILFIQIVLVIFVTVLTPSLSGVSPETFLKITQILDNVIATGIAVLSTPLFVIADYLIYGSLSKTKA